MWITLVRERDVCHWSAINGHYVLNYSWWYKPSIFMLEIVKWQGDKWKSHQKNWQNISMIMEFILIWWRDFVSILLTYIQLVIDTRGYEPFCSIEKEKWIDSRPSIEFDANGEIHSMRKCPPLYWETEWPANMLQEEWNNGLVMITLFVLIFFIHLMLMCLLTEN